MSVSWCRGEITAGSDLRLPRPTFDPVFVSQSALWVTALLRPGLSEQRQYPSIGGFDRDAADDARGQADCPCLIDRCLDGLLALDLAIAITDERHAVAPSLGCPVDHSQNVTYFQTV
jgi:hypothetical protein